jgi:N-acyl homoserine lactone hydrolase
MNAPASIAITPVLVADLHVEGERMPVYVHVIDHPDGRVLVDTGMTELHPAMADMGHILAHATLRSPAVVS